MNPPWTKPLEHFAKKVNCEAIPPPLPPTPTDIPCWFVPMSWSEMMIVAIKIVKGEGAFVITNKKTNNRFMAGNFNALYTHVHLRGVIPLVSQVLLARIV